MNAQTLYEKVAANMPNGKIPSLPVIHLGKDEQKEMIWFYYTLSEQGDQIAFKSTVAYTMDAEYHTEKKQISVSMQKAVGKFQYPDLSENDYYQKVAELFEVYQEAQMQKLLKSAEAEPLLFAYQLILEALENLEKEPVSVIENEALESQKPIQ